jgi:hypothetical protein
MHNFFSTFFCKTKSGRAKGIFSHQLKAPHPGPAHEPPDIKAPKSKHQGPEKHQTPSDKTSYAVRVRACQKCGCRLPVGDTADKAVCATTLRAAQVQGFNSRMFRGNLSLLGRGEGEAAPVEPRLGAERRPRDTWNTKEQKGTTFLRFFPVPAKCRERLSA